MKPSQEQCLEVAKFCVNYLYERHSNEKNLFRSGVSQTDVRTLQSQLVQGSVSSKMKDELDPHLIAEVLITTLKDMSRSLLLDVYDDVLSTDSNEEDFDTCKDNIQRWIVKLVEVSSLFQLLSKLAALDDNESSLLQLGFCVSPTICRPTTSAYMSIRHMEDLKRIRPVVSFIIENYDDVFVQGLRPLKAVGATGGDSQTSSQMAVESTPSKLYNEQALASPCSPVQQERSSSFDETPRSADKGFHSLRPNLLVMIPPTAGSPADGSSLSLDLDGLDNKPGHHYSDGEWNALEALVQSHVTCFMDFDEREVRRSSSMDSNSSSGQPSPKSLFNLSVGKHATTSGFVGSSSFSSKSHSSSVRSQDSDSSIARRRRMVADCKAMRAQIFEFEQEWTRTHNRIPKTYERGNMQAVYSRYRDLKKDIRNLAAVDLQRCARGYIVRSKSLSSLRVSVNKTASQWSRQPTTASKELRDGTHASAHRSAGDAHSAAGEDLYGRYKELLTQKRDLKKRLKKFDEDFLEQRGCQPKKVDKEVIRPMYQKYHEVKSSLDELKLQIEQSHGPLPDELLEEGGRATTVPSSATRSTSGQSTDSDADGLGASRVSGTSKYLSSDDEGGGADHERRSKLHQQSDKSKFLTHPPESGSLDALLLEKTNLHAYLKVYERDFNKLHGRPVMRQEDIHPVAHEYQRYKELKGLIRDAKAASKK